MSISIFWLTMRTESMSRLLSEQWFLLLEWIGIAVHVSVFVTVGDDIYDHLDVQMVSLADNVSMERSVF